MCFLDRQLLVRFATRWTCTWCTKKLELLAAYVDPVLAGEEEEQ